MAMDENCPSNAGRQVTPNNKMLVNGSPGSHQQQQQQQQHQISTEDQSHKSINKLRIQENPLHHDEDRRYSEAICVKLPQEHSIDRFSVFRRRSRYRLAIIVAVVSLSFLIAILFYLAFFARWSSTDSELNVCLTAECVRTAASLLNAMDQSADPCDDFFQFACGSWNKKHTIPDDRSSISTFEVMADDLQVILKDVLEQPANNQDNSATIKSKTFYKSCMATDQIEEIGDKPLKDVIEELGGWPVTILSWSPPDTSLEHLLGKLRGDYNQQIILEQWVGPDDKNSSVNVIQLDQPLFGLPSREYFVKESSERERNAYLKLMIEVATIFGADRSENTEKEMEDVLKMETRLANASAPEADRQDTGEIYKSMSLSELSDVVPEFDWLYYLNTFLPTKVTEDEPVVIYALQYLREMGQIIAQTDRKTVHNYAIWRFVKQMLPFLDGEYSLKRREFNKVLSGVSQERPRWNQCVDLVNKKLGMAVGALFIRDNFDPKSKETAQVMISNLREAFSELLEENAWMDKDTREVAELKANAMTERIGYPELLKNPVELSKEYETLTVHDDLFLINILNVLEFEATKNLKKLRQPVNKDRWTTEPAVVNAFYSPNKNDIVFPAGILQPLFYSQYFPKSLNYGGIGVVIGHEITHGFDDKGRQFDRDGNLKQWWNNATILRFRERAQCIIDQYSSYVLEDIGHNINGKMTQGENIADNGGLKQSYRAFKKWVSRHGNEPLLPGLNLTHDQLFFLNYAQIWCGSNRPEDALSKIRTSVHSPGPIRVLGPLSNSFDFAKAYKCPLGSRMNPNKKCSVW